MNTHLRIVLFTCFFLGILGVSCQSNEQKEDGSFEQVKENKILLNDSILVENILFSEPVKTAEAKMVSIDKWAAFETEVEKKIQQNEVVIKKIKSNPGITTRSFKKLTKLEEDNQVLRLQLNEFNAEIKESRENFKMSFAESINTIRMSLNDLSVDQDK